MTVPILSIITVVKDDLPGLIKTSISLRGQDLHGVEWVIIDSSRDPVQAADLPKELSSAYICHWVEPEGIYPAMNVGLRQASGDYVWFLNAGDTVAKQSTIRNLVEILLRNQPAWVVGQVTFVRADGLEVRPPALDYAAEKKRLFARGRFPPHQGTIVKRQLLLAADGFDTRFHIAADYHSALRLSELEGPLVTQEILAAFPLGGVSSQHWKRAIGEFRAARRDVLDIHGYRRFLEAVDTYKLYTSMLAARFLKRV